LNVYSAAALNVVDRISDPLIPELDPSLLDFGPMNVDFGTKKDDPLNWASQSILDPVNIEPKRLPLENRLDDDDMHIELELDLGDDDTPSIEIGRKDKAPSRPIEDDIISDNDKFSGLGNLRDNSAIDDSTRSRLSSLIPPMEEGVTLLPLGDGEMVVDDVDGFPLPVEDDLLPPAAPIATEIPDLSRDSLSPLSSVRSSVVREFEMNSLDAFEDNVIIHQAQKAKKRKLLQADTNTVIPQTQITQQQADRSAILKPVSLLSRDPVLLNLMSMQRDGGFVSYILGEGRAKGWAPELRGILSIEVVRKSGELKRKRQSSFKEVDREESHAGMTDLPQLEIPEDDTNNFAPMDEGIDMNPDTTLQQQSGIADDPPAEVELPPVQGDDPLPEISPLDQPGSDEEAMNPEHDPFDETTAPLLYPEEQGAVSMGTQHAVHLLRDRFASSKGQSSSRQNMATILFQDMLPEATTSKAEATKMFFEVLVLATKDAVKVEQSEGQLGGAIRIRGKRGLWGAWAEKEAGGEISEQEVHRDTAATAL
jgi:cohesin complex subunit SCC1